jgi:heat shock protein HspQ
MEQCQAKFCIGQVIVDPQFRFRGVVIDVDHQFMRSEAWYRKNAPHHPPKNEPWYHILVHNSNFRIYVAESSLEPDLSGEPVQHPEIDYFFAEFNNGVYVLRRGYDV